MKTNLKKNKRADVPVVILVLGVLAICGLAIMSFVFSVKLESGKSALGVGLVEQINADIEKFYFYRDFVGDDCAAAADKIGAKCSGGLVIEKESLDKKIKIKYEPRN